MRNTLLLLFISCTLFTYSQKRNIELTDIWAGGTFYPKTISGFVSLNDGKFAKEKLKLLTAQKKSSLTALKWQNKLDKLHEELDMASDSTYNKK